MKDLSSPVCSGMEEGWGQAITVLSGVITAGVSPYDGGGELRSHAVWSWGGRAKLKAS